MLRISDFQTATHFARGSRGALGKVEKVTSMSDKFAQYTDVLNRLVAETVACTPKEWPKGTLTIESDGTRINYWLKNEEQPGKALISEKLRDLIDELYVRMSNQGDTWTVATIGFFQQDEAVTFNTSFQYAKPKQSQASPAAKPWWKVW